MELLSLTQVSFLFFFLASSGLLLKALKICHDLPLRDRFPLRMRPCQIFSPPQAKTRPQPSWTPALRRMRRNLQRTVDTSLGHSCHLTNKTWKIATSGIQLGREQYGIWECRNIEERLHGVSDKSEPCFSRRKNMLCIAQRSVSSQM